MVKLTGKRKLLVITLIIGVVISLFTYAQYKQAEENRKRLGNINWRTALGQQVASWESRIRNARTTEEMRRELRARVAQQKYYLDHNMNPNEPGAPTFVRGFVERSIDLLLPLMMMVIAADLVSSEFSSGTIKALLTQSVRRWQILLSKYLALLLAISFILLLFAILSTIISGLVFGFKGWNAPVLLGFSFNENQLDASDVRQVAQWQFIWMELGLAWLVSVVIATITFMLSVLVRSTAAVMGIMLSCLIAGTILSTMVEAWDSAKYLFIVNLKLAGYLANAAPPVEGMSLLFSITVLLVWGLAALAIAFLSFTRRDVL
jgi:ABC-2 type transport system permease protein